MTLVPAPLPVAKIPEVIPPLAFTRGYQAALAQGTDLLELNDACWED
jgi:hypothetical protein